MVRLPIPDSESSPCCWISDPVVLAWNDFDATTDDFLSFAVVGEVFVPKPLVALERATVVKSRRGTVPLRGGLKNENDLIVV